MMVMLVCCVIKLQHATMQPYPMLPGADALSHNHCTYSSTAAGNYTACKLKHLDSKYMSHIQLHG